MISNSQMEIKVQNDLLQKARNIQAKSTHEVLSLSQILGDDWHDLENSGALGLRKTLKFSEWFPDIINKVKYAQNVQVSQQEADFIREQLVKDKYPACQRPLAELWILRGNWRYKSPKKLQYRDFYPTIKELEEFKQSVFFIEDVKALIQSLKKHYYAYAESVFQAWKNAHELNRDFNIISENSIDFMIVQSWDQIFKENSRLKSEIATLQSENQKLKQEVGK